MQAEVKATACTFNFLSRWPSSSGGGLQNRRARGSTVAAHHFADVAQQQQVLAHGHSTSREADWPHASALSIGSISHPW